jgi:2-succinyl-5-enolpyruvyl-6-hydroxy-3-cyclohexene-1-carboxylate synthase
VPNALGDAEAWFDAGLRACEAAIGAPSGPVQVNACFEEPLVPDQRGAAAWSRRVAPAAPARSPDRDAAVAALTAFRDAFAGRRGVIALGPARPPVSLSCRSTLLGWPVLAEPLSGLRLTPGGPAGDGAGSSRSATKRGGRAPAGRAAVGATPTTRATQSLVAATDAVVVLDRDHPIDPRGVPSGASRSTPRCSQPRLGRTRWPAIRPPTLVDGCLARSGSPGRRACISS